VWGVGYEVWFCLMCVVCVRYVCELQVRYDVCVCGVWVCVLFMC
jgi:hypothetical protein